MLWTDFLNKFQPMFEEPGDPGGNPPAGDPPAADPKPSLISGGEGDPPADGDPKPGEGDPKPAEGDPAPEPLTAESFKVPEGMPEGVELDPESLGNFVEILNDGELSKQELGQKLIDMQLNMMLDAEKAAAEASQSAWDATTEKWVEECKALPEIGGDNVEKSLAQIKNGLTQLGATKETFEAFDITGAGSHPEIVKILFAATKHLAEGPAVQGDPPADKLSQADRLFGGQST